MRPCAGIWWRETRRELRGVRGRSAFVVVFTAIAVSLFFSSAFSSLRLQLVGLSVGTYVVDCRG